MLLLSILRYVQLNFAPFALHSVDIELQFEKAYSLYRLNKTQEALNTLNAIEELKEHEKELKAQVVRENFSSIIHIISSFVQETSV